MSILVTGSSGFVASQLIPILKKEHDVLGLDLKPSIYTDYVVDISSKQQLSKILLNYNIEIIINLAAARFDFGPSAEEYYKSNVTCHSDFLSSLNDLRIKHFIHVSSVASIDGQKINFNHNLGYDDSYRSTKYLQEKLILDWCRAKDIKNSILYPSAIFSFDPRPDTNIGKVQKLIKLLPIIPSIKTKKSLTFIENFSTFIKEIVSNKIPNGKYLTVERPVLSFDEIINKFANRRIFIIKLPFLKNFLLLISWFLYLIGGFGKFDLKLTPNRVKKLYTDTSYDDVDKEFEIDIHTYNNISNKHYSDIS